MRARLAPSAVRTAISFRRASARASRRLATFGARDEQHESNGANQHDERSPDVADDLFLQRHDAEGQAAVGRIRQAG